MSIVETSTPQLEQNKVANVNLVQDKAVAAATANDTNDIPFKLGLWLSGLESFLNLQANAQRKANLHTYDWSKDVRIFHSVLLLSSRLTLDLAQIIKAKETSNSKADDFELLDQSNLKLSQISSEEIIELSFALKETILLSEGFLRAKPLKFNEWASWSKSLTERLVSLEVFQKLIKNAELEGEQFLPKALIDLLSNESISADWDADFQMVLPRFAKSLKWLSIVGNMLKNDEPLKTTIVLFARVYDQIQEMMSFINNRLLRFSDEEDALFGSLDSAAYTASIELRKVFTQELDGLIDLRPTPLIYAKIETAYSLLNDSLQLTLVNFAQLIDYSIDPTDIFPNLHSKEEQSIKLRENMWNLLQTVKTAEKDAENYPLDNLQSSLKTFRDENLYFLFYKDMETVDRFIEEVLITDKKELVPILHRFGAYIETLLGQVNMRAVLANHPFEPLQRDSHKMFM